MVPSEFQGRNAITVADADATIDDANHIDQSTNDVNHAENHVTHLELFEAVEESVLSCKPLVDFFYHFDKSTKTVDNDSDFDGDDDTCADEGEEKKQKRKNYGRGRHAASVTLSDRRVAICNVVKSVKFNKTRARRLFAGMIPLLNKIFEEESYFTTKSHESESDGSVVDGDGNISDVNNGDEDCTSDERNGRGNDEHMHEESSSQSILYLRCCAYLMEAYLRGLIERITHKRKPRNKNSNNTTINSQNEHNSQDAIPIIDEAYQVAEILHSALFPLYQLSTADPSTTLSKQSKQTISSIFGVCETYWHGHFEDREQFVTQLIPLLLIKCLDVTAQKADIKRLFSIREALNLLDFEDEESIASLRLHLLRTVSSPLFLQSAEGRKFISHLFQLHPSFVIDLHQAIKVQLPEVKKSILKAYAEIYFTAWKTSCDSRENDSQKDESEDIQTAIEENALQDIMHAGIHAAVPNTAKTVRLVLDQFYTKKKTPAVESMLHRLYGPLLWRALSSSHARVRTQASVVLVDTFPLRDPHAGREATEVCVKKSVAALASLLEDDVPSVRVAGATAASKILSSFWVAIPSKDIQFLLNIIIAKHASDSTSSNVRSSAVIAIQTLLEEEKTHAVLRPLLPSLGNLIHDKTEKVRLAVVKLLLFVKKVRGMKYYHVVPAHHLLVRLEDEGCRGNPTGPVAMALTDLLSNSFFPSSNSKKKTVTMTEIINRTLRLLTDNPGAALVFYRNASSTLSVGSISKLIAALMKCLVMFIEEEKEHRPEDFGEDINNIGTSLKDGVSVEDSKKGNDTNAKLFKEKNNMALMATIAESISALWDSIKNELSQSQNESCDELLKDVFSGNVLTEVYEHFASKFENEEDFEDSMLGDCFRACVAILHCAGKMDEVKIEGLRTRIVKNIASLNSISVEKRSKMNFSPSVSLLCVWGMTENVSQCLGSSITLYFGGDGGEHDVEYCQESKESKKRKSFAKVNAKGKSAQLLPQLDMDVCIGILGHILKGCFPASVSARENILTSETAYSAIEGALGMAQIAAENILKPKVASELKLNFDMIRSIGISLECYGRLALHKEAIKKEIPMSMPPELNALLDWISDVVIPSLVKLSCQDSTLRDLDLSMISGTGSLCSPVSSGPPKRKMNRDSSPLEPRLSNESFISAEASFNFYQEKSSFSLSKATAISAINSVLCTYAEWISFRFVCDSTSITQVSKWCQVLKNADKTVKRTLLPVFLRISLVIMKNCGNLDLFHEIIQSIEDVDLTFADEEILETFMSTLIELRDDKLLCDVVKSTFSTFCSTVSRIPDSEREKDVDVLQAAGQCIRALVMSMLRDCRSSLMLARFLVENPNSGSKSIYSGKSLRFHVLKKMKEFSPQMQSLTKLLTKLDDENDTANMTEAG